MLRLADIAPESVALAGAGRAILLQIAYPEIGYGVARHSDFASRPMKRLNATLSYIYALSNGSADDVRIMRSAVNRAHAAVRNPPRGGVPDAGVPAAHPHDPAYDARDPHLQLWVAATLYDTAVGVYERVFGPLDDESGERVYAEYARLGTTLQMPMELWPADRAAFRVYWDATIDRLRVDPTIRGVADALLGAEKVPVWLKAGMPVARFVTVGLLPPPVREQFGYDWSVRHDRRLSALFRAVGPVYRALPVSVRRWPQRHYLRELRARAT